MNGKFKKSRLLRRLAILITVLVLLSVFVLPAAAITYGQPDGNDHPFVGSMVLRLPSGAVYQMCSGTLITENVFLTASHCTASIDGLLASIPGAEVLVTFDPTISEGGTFYTGTWYTNPKFNTGAHSDPGDVAVIVLDQSPGITPARLPTAGLLDHLKDDGTLRDTHFTAVGYGTIRVTNTRGPAGILDNLDRNRVDQEFLSLTKAWVTMSMNLATGNGGTCYGDSGGPHFIHMNGVETDIVVAVTVTGDAVCAATDKDYRVDTESARSFLEQFVDLP